MIYIIFFTAIITIIFVLGKISLFIHFNKLVKQLFSQSNNNSEKQFSYLQLEGLPEPVKRYFKYVLKEGQPYIKFIRLKQNGQFKVNLLKDWFNITAEQYFTSNNPGFIWRGTTPFFEVNDMYIGDRGKLTFSLFSFFKIFIIKDEQYNKEVVLRWLGECILFPTSLLPSEKLKWTFIDEFSSKLIFDYNGFLLEYKISFNEKGEIVQMETKKRSMNKKDFKTFIIKPKNYQEKNNVVIPTEAEVFWELKDGEFSCAKFIITTIDYNIAERF